MIDSVKDALQLYKENRLPEAVAFLEKTLLTNPNEFDALEALGVIYGKMGRLDQAIELMKKLAALNPDGIMAHTNLSQFYAQKGMIDEAEAEQAEARRLSWKAELREKKLSESEISHILLGDDEESQRVLDEKIERYKQVIDLDPNDVLGYFSLGSAYLQGKRFVEAEKTFRKAIEVGKDHSPSYVNLGEALEAMGRKKEAIQVYESGIPVADQKGDMVPLRKMESRIRKIRKELGDSA